jgi:cytidine deaminase
MLMSHRRVGAALLADDGVIINGCNVENASYGGSQRVLDRYPADRIRWDYLRRTHSHHESRCTPVYLTPIAPTDTWQSEGKRRFTALAVTSDIPTPTISPCGLCRQVLREFLPLATPVYMVASGYPWRWVDPPAYLAERSGEEWDGMVKVMTMEQLLPMSFGPDELLMRGSP